MRMNKILAAACVLAAASSVAVGESGTRIVQADDSSYIMDSEETQKDAASKKSDSYYTMDTELSDEEQKKLFAEYAENGIDIKDGALYFQNKPVRCFADTCRIVEKVNESGGKTRTYKNICSYANWSGTVDIYIIREEVSNKAENNGARGKIESVKKASSIRDMVFSVSAESLAKIAESGYNAEGLSAVYEILPFIPHESIDGLAKKAAGNGNYDALKIMAEYLSEEMITEIVNSEYERTGLSGVRALLPLMSQQSVDKLAKKAVDKNDIKNLEQMAFFVDIDLLDKIAKKLDSKGKRVAGIAPFMSEKALKEIVAKAYKRTGITGVYEFLPSMPEKLVDKYIQKAAAAKDYEAVEKMAPYASKKVLKKIADKMLAAGKSIAGIEVFIK